MSAVRGIERAVKASRNCQAAEDMQNYGWVALVHSLGGIPFASSCVRLSWQGEICAYSFILRARLGNAHELFAESAATAC